MKKEINLLYFKAMKNFLEKWFEESKCECDSVATLLTSMDLNWRGGHEPFDPALWDDWLESVDVVLKGSDSVKNNPS